MNIRRSEVRSKDQAGRASAGQLGVALVGLGSWGIRLARGIVGESTMALRWLCDRDAGRLDDAREIAPAAVVTTSYRQLLDNPEVEALVVAVAPEDNGNLALEAVRANKHVLVEKPFATNLSLARAMAREAQVGRVVVGVGHVLRYHPVFRELERLLVRGDLGAPLGIFSERLGPHRPRRLGPWWVLGPHDLSLAAEWFGPGDCRAKPCAEEQVEAFLRFRKGGVGRLVLGRSAERRRELLVVTERAIVRADETQPSLHVHVSPATERHRLGALAAALEEAPLSRVRAAYESLALRLPAHPVTVGPGDALKEELAAFSAAVRLKKPLVTSARASLPVLEMLLQGHESMEQVPFATAEASREDASAAFAAL